MKFVATIVITGLVTASIVSLGAAAPSGSARIVYRRCARQPQRPPELYSVCHRNRSPAACPWSRSAGAVSGSHAHRVRWRRPAQPGDLGDEGGRPRPAEAHQSRGDGEPTWSPDARRIAFRRDLGGSFDLWVVPAAGGSARRLFGGRTTNELAPDWSPAGGQIAFQGNRGGVNQIWILTLRTHVRRLTRGEDSFQPDWAPDGSESPSRRGVGSRSSRRRPPRILPTGVPRSAYDPSWSRDGRRIAFERGGQVLTMRAGGGDPLRHPGLLGHQRRSRLVAPERAPRRCRNGYAALAAAA